MADGSIKIIVDGDSQPLEKTLKGVGGLAQKSLKGVGDIAKKALSAAAVGAVALGTALIATMETTREYREEMNKLDTAFETTGKTVKQGREIFKDFYGILGETDQSVEAVSHLAELTDNQEELGKWTNISAGVLTKFGDSLPLEGLTEAANETAKVGKVTGSLADALNWAGVNEDAFNKQLEACTTETERATLITETLDGIYGELGETYRDTNSAIIKGRENNLIFMDTLAQIGGKVEELKNALVNALLPAIQPIIDKMLEFVNSIDADKVAEKVSEFVGYIFDGFQQVATFIQPAIDKMGEFYQELTSEENKELASAAWQSLIDLATGFVDNLTTYVLPLVSTFFDDVSNRISLFYTDIVEPTFTFVSDKWVDMWGIIQGTWEEHGQGIFEGVNEALRNNGKNWEVFWTEIVQPIFEDFMEDADVLWDEHLKPLYENFAEFVAIFIENATKLYNECFAPLMQQVTGEVAPSFTETFSMISDYVFEKLSKMTDDINDFITLLTGLSNFLTGAFTGDWSQAWTGVKEMFTACFGDMVTAAKEKMNSIIGHINGMIGAVNSAISRLNGMSVTIPEWAPVGAGETFGFSIPTLGSVPYLANGAVLKPNSPFLAVVGDQTSGTNVEAPLSTIKQAMREVLVSGSVSGLLASSGAYASHSNAQSTQMGNTLNITVNANGDTVGSLNAREIAKAIGRETQREMRARGLTYA